MSDVPALNNNPDLVVATFQEPAAVGRSSVVNPEIDRADSAETPRSSDPSLAATTRLEIEHRHGRYIYTIYDPTTGKILQQIPDERLLQQRDGPEDAAAVLLGVTV